MGQVKICDASLWIKHIHGDLRLQKKLTALQPGGRVHLRVGGVPLEFEKMRNRPDGPTPGIKPVGKSKEIWLSQFYPRQRNELLDIRPDDGSEPASPEPAGSSDSASEAERDAAWEAFRSLARAGWRSSGTAKADRGELHQR